MTLTAKQIEEVYFAIGRGQAVIEKNADGEDGVTIAVETGQEYAADYLIAEGMTLIGLGRFAGPLLAFLSIFEPTKMGNGSLPRNDFILLPGLPNQKITLSGDTLKQFLPPLSHFDPNYVETDHRHWTALHRAMYEGNVRRVKWLIDNGARVQADDLGHYPHQVATHPAIDPAAHDQIVRLVDPNYVETDGRHWTALHRAMYEGNVKRAQWLIDNGAKVQTDDLGHYPHQVATHPAIDPAAHDQIIQLVDPNYVETDHQHWTTLHRAVYEGNINRMKWLLANNAILKQDTSGHYPHQIAPYSTVSIETDSTIKHLISAKFPPTPTSVAVTQPAASAPIPSYPTPAELAVEKRPYGRAFMEPTWSNRTSIAPAPLPAPRSQAVAPCYQSKYKPEYVSDISRRVQEEATKRENERKRKEQELSKRREVAPCIRSAAALTGSAFGKPSPSGLFSTPSASYYQPTSPSISVRPLPPLPGVKGRDQFFKPGPPPKAGQNRGCPAGHVLMPATAQHPKECYKLVMCK